MPTQGVMANSSTTDTDDGVVIPAEFGVRKARDLSVGEYAMQYKAAVVFISGWIENRLINQTKANMTHMKKIQEEGVTGVVNLTSEGDESEAQDFEENEEEEEEIEDEDKEEEGEEDEEVETVSKCALSAWSNCFHKSLMIGRCLMSATSAGTDEEAPPARKCQGI